jgi:hypothetical protein
MPQLCTGRWCRWIMTQQLPSAVVPGSDGCFRRLCVRVAGGDFFDNSVDCIRQPIRDEISLRFVALIDP